MFSTASLVNAPVQPRPCHKVLPVGELNSGMRLLITHQPGRRTGTAGRPRGIPTSTATLQLPTHLDSDLTRHEQIATRLQARSAGKEV
jgi:hypothetical protein